MIPFVSSLPTPTTVLGAFQLANISTLTLSSHRFSWLFAEVEGMDDGTWTVSIQCTLQGSNEAHYALNMSSLPDQETAANAIMATLTELLIVRYLPPIE